MLHRSLVSALLVAGVLLVTPRARGQEQQVAEPTSKPAAKQSELGSVSLDGLIDRLPSVEKQYRRGERADEYWKLDPVAEELKSRLAAGAELSAAQWQLALERAGCFRFPKKWPAESPVVVCAKDAAWLPCVEITLAPKDKSLKPLVSGVTLMETCGNAAEWRARGQMHQTLGKLPVGKHHLEFEATVTRGQSLWIRGSAKPGLVWSGPLAFDVEIVPTLDDARPPVSDEATAAAIRQSVGICVQKWGEDRHPVAIFVLDPDLAKHPALKTTALSMRVELLKDGEVQASHAVALSKYDSVLAIGSAYGGKEADAVMFTFAVLEQLPPRVDVDPAEAAHWSLRLTGTSDGVLDLWHADKRWAGAVTIPVTEAVKLEKDRMEGKPERIFAWMP